MPNYLVIKTSSLGDILQTLPAVLSLKKSQKQAKITWVVEKRFKNILIPFGIDEILVVDFRRWKKSPLKSFKDIMTFIQKLRSTTFDKAIDFQANVKSGVILGFAKALEKRSFLDVAEWPHKLIKAKRIIPSYDNCLEFNKSLVIDLITSKDFDLPPFPIASCYPPKKIKIMLGLGSVWPSKKLDNEQISQLMLNIALKHDVYFVIPALASEKVAYQSLLNGLEGEVIAKNELQDYIPDLLSCDYFFGVDSALLHLARLLKIPSKAYFGPSNAHFYGKTGDEQGFCPYNQKFVKRCARLRYCPAPCMRSVSLAMTSFPSNGESV